MPSWFLVASFKDSLGPDREFSYLLNARSENQRVGSRRLDRPREFTTIESS
jgi:hypothetical protein